MLFLFFTYENKEKHLCGPAFDSIIFLNNENLSEELYKNIEEKIKDSKTFKNAAAIISLQFYKYFNKINLENDLNFFWKALKKIIKKKIKIFLMVLIKIKF